MPCPSQTSGFNVPNYVRDSISDPYPPELKGSPGFESVSTAYKTALSQDEEARQHQPHSSAQDVLKSKDSKQSGRPYTRRETGAAVDELVDLSPMKSTRKRADELQVP
ncbi:hypothetical protein ANN_20555 [Periplaneta americana]|uniref:Uncharacterized protein n=1 Tax=Periplaneta americana TaxID=6978 RepID=A0ABQ8SE26_PERAM|nr:hypothetical protein ANN_20555 [Periplaneta americana]